MPEKITSRQNQQIKQAVKLRTRRGRLEQNRIIVDGIREIERALSSGVEFTKIFVSESPHFDANSKIKLLIDSPFNAQCFEVQATAFEKLCFGNRNEGIVAVAMPPKRDFSDLPTNSEFVLGVLEGIEKPGNLGAVVRSADAAGIHGMIVCDGRTDLYNPNAIRASLGTIFSLPVVEASSLEAIDWLATTGTKIYVARVDGEHLYCDVNFQGRTAIVLGSEARGVSEKWRRPEFAGIKLPMCGVVDSLNISATAAVLFYEAHRQGHRD